MRSTTETYTHLYDVHAITDYNKITLDQIRYKTKEKIYACVDYNAFYAQVEEWDNDVGGFPLIIGGWRDDRGIAHGIVATSNYAARAYGISTGRSALEAAQSFEHVLMFQVDYNKYKSISSTLLDVYHEYSHSVEKYSLDEVFMDMTGHLHSVADCEDFVRRLKRDIWEVHKLTVNVGIARTKSHSKVVADLNKPDGHMIVLTDEAKRQIIDPLPVNKLWGIGKRRSIRLNANNLYTIGDIAAAPRALLQRIFGVHEGEIIWLMSTGNEETIIVEKKLKPIQSVGYMHTFPTWTVHKAQIWGEFVRGIERACYRLRGFQKKASEFYMLFRPQDDVESYGHSIRIEPTHFDQDVIQTFRPFFDQLYQFTMERGIRVRGVGIYCSRFENRIDQLDLFKHFDWHNYRLYRAIDRVKNKYEFDTMRWMDATVFVKGRTHFVDRSKY